MTSTSIEEFRSILKLDSRQWPEDKPKEGFIKYKFKDCSGIIIRHYSGGKKSFTCRVTDENGKRPTITLGHRPAMTPTQAHKKYLDFASTGVITKQKADENKQKALRAVQLTTVEALMPLYVEEHLETIKKSTAVNFNRIVENDLVPFLEAYDNLNDVPHPDIKTHILDIKATRGIEPARKAFHYFNSFFTWAVDERKLTNNPVGNIRFKKLKLKAKSRDRALSMAEAKLFLAALDSTNRLQDRTRIGLEILLLTAVRSGELLQAEWKHIDIKKAEWQLPEENVKTNQQFKMMLAPQTLELFKKLKSISKTNKVMDGLSRGAMLKALARLQQEDASGNTPLALEENLTCHDLRRSAATLLGELNVSDDLVRQYLNHRRNRETATYNRAKLLKQRLDAAKLLADKLGGLRNG
jgi:integrase